MISKMIGTVVEIRQTDRQAGIQYTFLWWLNKLLTVIAYCTCTVRVSSWSTPIGRIVVGS